MGVDDTWLAEAAGAILDGRTIDWGVTDRRSVEDQSVVDCLRVIEAIAGAHRQVPASVQSSSASTEQMWGRLRLLEIIGEGGFGRVYRAFDSSLQREVALKLLPPSTELHDRAVVEARLLARVRHPNVVTIYGVDRFNGQTGLWMELIHGTTLADQRGQANAREVRDVVTIGIELCRALQAVHAAGLVHGDIKPQNVMRGDEGRVVLMDFGTGRELANTESSDACGTPLYAAPEVLGGQPPTAQSDIYSLGVLLFFLLARRHPVYASNLAGLRQAHERREQLSLRVLRPRIPSALRKSIEKAIDPDPTRRFQNAEAFSCALARRNRSATRTFTAVAASVIAGISWLLGDLLADRNRSLTPARSAAVTMAATTPVVIVLPFKNMSDEDVGGYFADGFTTDLIGALTRLNGIAVRSPSSSFAFKDHPTDLKEIARQLGAAFIVEGTVARADQRLRVTAQLVETSAGRLLWAERFERTLPDLFDIQDKLARSIATRLELTVSPRAALEQPDVQTYDIYLRARVLLDRRSLGAESARAADLFRQVIHRDPSYAPAYAGLALAYAYMSLNPYPIGALTGNGNGVAFDESNALMREAAERSLALAPTLAEAHAAMGWVHARAFDWTKARASFHRALRLNPIATHTHTNFSYSTLRPLQLHKEAEAVLRTALVHDPLSIGVRRELAELLLQAGRVDEAVAEFRRLAVDDPRASAVHAGRALTQSGDATAAIAQLESLGPGAAAWLAHAYVQAGRRSEAEQLARTHHQFPFRRVVIATALGDKESAIEALARMADSEPQRLGLLLAQPELVVLKGDPRVAALRARLRLP